MTEKRWIYPGNQDEAVVRHLMEVLKISEPLAQILAGRNISTYAEARRFFRPSLDMLHDPFLMADMDNAVERLIRAINDNEKVLIYGDYDVDGTTAVAMFYHFLTSFYDNCEYYIPNRYTEGYGVSLAGIQYAVDQNFSLIITLDCGIKSVELVEYASGKGIDFIICDHHEPDSRIPPAAAVLDPKRKDCPYPYKELSGCGVGFKLIQAFLETHPGIDYDPYDLLDLLCVSIAADIVPVTGENRVLAYFGLIRLRENARPGLRALMEIAGIDHSSADLTNVVFGLAPRINAAGRLEDARHAVRLMLAEDGHLAAEFAGKLDAHNSERRNIDRQITMEAHAMIRDNGWHNTKSTVLFQEDWHKGVIGIVASRCIETWYRPTVILTKNEEGNLTGSARSVEGFDLYSALDQCSDLLEQFGGHKHAAGMTLKNENLDAFRLKFEEVVSREITSDLLKPTIKIDAMVSLRGIDAKFYRILRQMAPFGPGNPEPVFCIKELTASDVRAFSSRSNPDSSHLKMTVTQPGSIMRLPAIGFNLGYFAEELQENPEGFSMAFTLGTNTYMGRTTLQMYIKDIRWE